MRRIDSGKVWGMRYNGKLIPYDPNFIGDYKAERSRLMPERDYRLMLAVVRAAGIVKAHRNHSLRDMRLAADFLIDELDAFNALPKGKPR